MRHYCHKSLKALNEEAPFENHQKGIFTSLISWPFALGFWQLALGVNKIQFVRMVIINQPAGKMIFTR